MKGFRFYIKVNVLVLEKHERFIDFFLLLWFYIRYCRFVILYRILSSNFSF